MPSNIVFLDYDGVIRLGTNGSGIGPPDSVIRRDLLSNVKELCDRSGAELVISSTWRHDGLQLTREWLAQGYLENYIHRDWRTGTGPRRWNEVAAWLVAHPEVSQFVILDDFKPEFDGAPFIDRLVLCSNRHGFNSACLTRALSLFGVGVPSSFSIQNDNDL